MALQPSRDASELLRQPGLIDEKRPASPTRSTKSLRLQQPDADRTLAPSRASTPPSTKDSEYVDDDEYPDGGARAWLIILGVSRRVGLCGVRLTASSPNVPINRRSAQHVRRAFYSLPHPC